MNEILLLKFITLNNLLKSRVTENRVSCPPEFKHMNTHTHTHTYFLLSDSPCSKEQGDRKLGSNPSGAI
jgi:hypothetical protein